MMLHRSVLAFFTVFATALVSFSAVSVVSAADGIGIDVTKSFLEQRESIDDDQKVSRA